jgi:hypothetical protein
VWWALPLPLLAWLGTRFAWRGLERGFRVPIAFAATNALLLLGFYLFAAPVLSEAASDASLARLADKLAPDVRVMSFRIQPASFSYYSNRPVLRANLTDEVIAAAKQGPLLIVTRRRHEAKLRAAGIPLHEWVDTGRHLLYATIAPRARSGAQ